jgi:hypothetical protein
MRKGYMWLLALVGLIVSSVGASAASTYDEAAVTALVTSGTTVFGVVATLVLAIVGFGILVKIVRKIRG